MVDIVQSTQTSINAEFPIQVGNVQNPYRPFTYTLQPGAQETIYYNFNYFRILALSGGTFQARFGGSGAEAEFPGAGLAYEAPVVLERVTIRNSGATAMTFTVALAVGRVLDDRLQYSGSVVVTNTAATPLYVAPGTGAIFTITPNTGTTFTTKPTSPTASSTGQVSVGTSATSIIAANTTNRFNVTITASATQDLYIGGAAVTTSTGLRIPAGASYTTTNTRQIYGVQAAAATVSYEEETY